MTLRELFELEYIFEIEHDALEYCTKPVSIVTCETTEEIYYYEEDEWGETPWDKKPCYTESF